MPRALIKIVVLIAAFALPSGAAWAQTPADSGRYGCGPHMMWWGGDHAMIFGPLFTIVIIAMLIAGGFVLARLAGGPWQVTVSPHGVPPVRNPLDILKERFARGEIDKDEFEQRRHVLGD